MQTESSTGICQFCTKSFTQKGISRHLTSHLDKLVDSKKPGFSYHLKIDADSWDGKLPYFMHLWVDGTATFEQLDQFLRDSWLECCGHMSAFRNRKMARPDNEYGMFGMMDAYEYLERGDTDTYEKMMSAITGEIPMRKSFDVVFDRIPDKTTIEYEYDFGNSTNLEVIIMGRYPIKADKNITLLTINEPLNWECELCEKETAVMICKVCDWEGTPSLFCVKCVPKHKKECVDFADYAALPVVNSPRMGVCGYEGGEIDFTKYLPIRLNLIK